MKKVTVLGGGTGSFVVLTGLKKLPIDLAAIVSMMDSGGSTGRLRDQLGVLPPGDLRQCLVALSDDPWLWRELFLYRFESGDLKGHNFGNIFLSALEKVTQNYEVAIENFSYVLKTKGPVFPITFQKTHLGVEYENGVIIKEEGNIDENNPERSHIVRAFLEPQVEPNAKAAVRLSQSDVLIIGPGDLYTSIAPVLLVNGIKEIIQSSHAKIIYIMNLMTKAGQTTDYTAMEHLKDLYKYLGKYPDTIIVNSGSIPDYTLSWYKEHEEHPVQNDLLEKGFSGTIIESDLVDLHQFEKSTADELQRSILRHDSEKLSKILATLLI